MQHQQEARGLQEFTILVYTENRIQQEPCARGSWIVNFEDLRLLENGLDTQWGKQCTAGKLRGHRHSILHFGHHTGSVTIL